MADWWEELPGKETAEASTTPNGAASNWWEELPRQVADAPGSQPAFAELRPFQPGERVQNADGTFPTELIVTVPMGAKWANVPSLWMSPTGPVQLNEDDATAAAQQYAARSGVNFPTFDTIDAAVTSAQQRSSQGGATRSPLAQPAPFQSPMMELTSGQQFPSMAEMGRQAVAERDPAVIAARAGIETEGAPSDLRNFYAKLPPGMRDQMTEYMVNAYFHERTGGNVGLVPTRFDEGLGTHIYKDPTDGKWRPLNDIGMDAEDFKDFAKYTLAPTGAAIGGGMVGDLTGSPLFAGSLAVMADVATSAGMRTSDVRELVELGLLPEDVSPALEGGKEALWALGANIAGAGAGRIIRRMAAGPDRIPSTVDVDRGMVRRLLDRYNEQYGTGTPEGMDLTLDEKLSLVAMSPAEKAAAMRLRSRKEALQVSNEAQAALLERQQQNIQAYNQGLNQFLTTLGQRQSDEVFHSSGISGDDMLTASLRIIDELEAPAKAALQQHDAALAQAYTSADQVAQDLIEGASDPRRMPLEFKGVFDAAAQNFDDAMTSQYSAIGEATKGQKVFDITPIQEDLTAIRRQMQSDARFRANVLGQDTQGLTSRPPFRIGGDPTQSALDDEVAEIYFGTTFRPGASGLMLSDAARREAAQNTNYDYATINNALKGLRQRMRRMPANPDPDLMSALTRLEGTLETIRTDGLRQIDPALAASQEALDATYKLGKDALDRGIGKRLAERYLAPRPGQEGLLLPSTFDALFKGDAGAQSIRDIQTLALNDVFHADATNPVDMVGVRDNIRRGLLGQLSSEMATQRGAGGQALMLSPEAFGRFTRDYGDALRYVFSPQELSRMESATALRNALRAKENDVQAVKQSITRFPWGDETIANDPVQLIRRTWGPDGDSTKLMRSRQLREALRERGDPEGLMQDYRTLIAHDMLSQVSERGQINPGKLRDYLNTHQQQLAEWYTTARDRKSGTTLVNNLNTYAELGQSIAENASLSHVEKRRFLNLLNDVSRAYVGIFTTPGRILTAIKRVGGGASERKELDFILNPDKYVRNQGVYDVLDSPAWRNLMRGGGHTLMNYLRDDSVQEDTARTQQWLDEQRR